MRIDQFQQFINIVDYGSMSKAAEILNISQPALSVSMKKLEDKLGFSLFDKSGRTLNLTSYGEEVYQSAKRIINELEVMENICQDTNKNKHNLNVSNSFSILAKDNLIATLNSYEQDLVTCRFEDCSITKSIENVAAGISELGIIRYPSYKQKYINKILESKNLQCTVLANEPACIIVGPKNPLYHIDSNTINYKHLQSFSFITYVNELQDNIWMSFLKDLNIDYSHISLANVTQVFETVKKTKHIFIDTKKDHTHADWYDSNPIRFIEIDPTIQCSLAYIKRKNIKLSEIGKTYLNQLIDRINIWKPHQKKPKV